MNVRLTARNSERRFDVMLGAPNSVNAHPEKKVMRAAVGSSQRGGFCRYWDRIGDAL